MRAAGASCNAFQPCDFAWDVTGRAGGAAAGGGAEREHDSRAALARLTAREREVLQALTDRLSDKEIAARLHVAEKVVKSHMVSILGKLGVESRLQALVFALRHGAV